MTEPEQHPQPLTSLVDYQTGSIVSRTILARPAGTVTLFAFDQGENLSEHTAPYDALVIGQEGQLEIRLGDQVHLLGGGEFLLLPANHPHAVLALSPGKMLLIMIRG
jgi:quercetin dioxygenase-like cupin family protein